MRNNGMRNGEPKSSSILHSLNTHMRLPPLSIRCTPPIVIVTKRLLGLLGKMGHQCLRQKKEAKSNIQISIHASIQCMHVTPSRHITI